MQARHAVGQPRCSTNSRGNPNGKSKPPIHGAGLASQAPNASRLSKRSSADRHTKAAEARPRATTIGLRRVGRLEKSTPISVEVGHAAHTLAARPPTWAEARFTDSAQRASGTTAAALRLPLRPMNHRHVTLRQFRYFIAVAESGSVASASRMLNIAQSALTKSLLELEAELGSSLFERSSKGMALTPQGHRFLLSARKVIGSVADALRLNGVDSASELRGVLAVGVTSLVAGYYLSELFSRFRRNCPAVEVFVTEDTPRFLEHLLINGELDVAIMVSNALSEPQAMVAETLTRSPNRVWLAANHPLTARDELTLAECAAHDQIVLEADRIDDADERRVDAPAAEAAHDPAHLVARGGALAGRRRRRHRGAAGFPVPAMDARRRARGGAPPARRGAQHRRRPGVAPRLGAQGRGHRVHRPGARAVAAAARLSGR